MPALGCGVRGFPPEVGAKIAADALLRGLRGLQAAELPASVQLYIEIRFWETQTFLHFEREWAARCEESAQILQGPLGSGAEVAASARVGGPPKARPPDSPGVFQSSEREVRDAMWGGLSLRSFTKERYRRNPNFLSSIGGAATPTRETGLLRLLKGAFSVSSFSPLS